MNKGVIINVRRMALLLAAALTALTACRNDDDGAGSKQNIVFGQSAPSSRGADGQTRGTPVESGSIIPVGTSFGVNAYHKSGATTTANYMDAGITGRQVERSAATTYSYSPEKVWPASGNLKFFAYYPYIASSPTNNLAVSYGDALFPAMVMTYETSSNPTNHIDLMYAVTDYIGVTTPVTLTFKHALTRIDFQARIDGFDSDAVVKVTGITIKGIKTKGTLLVLQEPVDATPITHPAWTLDTNTGNVALTGTTGLNLASLDETYKSVVGTNGTLMLLPQEASGLEAEVTYQVNGESNTVSLAIGNDWNRNDWITYNIDIEMMGVNMKAEVRDWDDINVNGDPGSVHKLSISKTEVIMPSDPGATNLYLESNQSWVASYWKDEEATIPMTSNWFTISPESANAPTADSEIVINTYGYYEYGSGRIGYVKFTSGNKSSMLKVVQLSAGPNSITSRFARSNVLTLDGGETLTFGTHDDPIDSNLQGLMFRWGSLIGVGSILENTPYRIIFNKSNVSPVSWARIPYGGGSFYTASTNNLETTDEFKGYNNGLGYNAEAGVGDVCRYISDMGWVGAGAKWRLPTAEEWGLLFAETTYFAKHGGALEDEELIGLDTGQDFIDSGCWYGVGVYYAINAPENAVANLMTAPPGTVFLPASGYRDTNSGIMQAPGHFGVYWSGSPRFSSGAFSAYNVRFDETGLNQYNYFTFRTAGHAVRCIKEIPNPVR